MTVISHDSSKITVYRGFLQYLDLEQIIDKQSKFQEKNITMTDLLNYKYEYHAYSGVTGNLKTIHFLLVLMSEK